MVACPSCEIPSRSNTFLIVIKITLISVINEQWSTYHTSSLNFSVQLMEFLPWHCAQPVIPGRTSCLRACSLLYKGKYCTNSGRGPINAISPFSTLISCGNSSIEVERTKRPTGSDVLHPEASYRLRHVRPSLF